jgi:hypothetical protein
VAAAKKFKPKMSSQPRRSSHETARLSFQSPIDDRHDEEELTMSDIRSVQMTTRLEYRLLFATVYPIFLVAVLISRLMPSHSRWVVTENDSTRSIFSVARVATQNAIPFVFM